MFSAFHLFLTEKLNNQIMAHRKVCSGFQASDYRILRAEFSESREGSKIGSHSNLIKPRRKLIIVLLAPSLRPNNVNSGTLSHLSDKLELAGPPAWCEAGCGAGLRGRTGRTAIITRWGTVLGSYSRTVGGGGTNTKLAFHQQ